MTKMVGLNNYKSVAIISVVSLSLVPILINGNPIKVEEESSEHHIISPLRLYTEETSGFYNSRKPRKTEKLQDSWLARVDVDQYLKNKKAVKLQIKCILENNAARYCDNIGKEIKRLMPLAMARRNGSQLCPDCDPKQVRKIQQIIVHIQQNYPAEWTEGIKKFGAPY